MLLPMPFIKPLSTTVAGSAWTTSATTEGEPEQAEEEEEDQRDEQDSEREEVTITPVDDDRVSGIDRVALVIDDLDVRPAIVGPNPGPVPICDGSNRSDQDKKQSGKQPLALHYTETSARNGRLNDARREPWDSAR